MAANFSSISTASRCSLSPNPSIPHRWHRSLLNLSFSNEFETPRIVSVRAQRPSSEPRNPSIVSKANADGVEAGCGSESPRHSEGKDSSSSSSVIDFLTLCHSLKSTKRKGWVNHEIVGPESIADHMYRMALMALIVEDLPGVNRERCIKIAIVHDIAEAIVGDITPSDGVPKAEKSRMEQEALDEMCTVLGGGLRAEEIKELWTEYETNSTLEANLVKDFDKVEMILQALEYEKEHGKVLDEFFLSTAGKIQTEIGKKWAAEIHSRRNSRLPNEP